MIRDRKQNISQNFTNVKLRVGKEVELALGGLSMKLTCLVIRHSLASAVLQTALSIRKAST